MADKTRIYNSNQWRIWTYFPEVNAFLLNFSQLDGTDVLGTYGGTMLDVAYFGITPTNIEINEGVSVTNGIFLDSTPTTASIGFSVQNFDKTLAKTFYIGTDIWITLQNEEVVDDDVYFRDSPFFRGTITSFDVEIAPGSNFATISVEATSALGKALNTQIAVTKSTTITKADVLNTKFNDLNVPIDLAYGDSYNYATTTTETKAVGEFVSDFLACETWGLADHIGVPTYRFGNTLAWDYNAKSFFSDRDLYSVSGSLTDAEMTALTMNWSGLDSPTAVSLTNYNDSAIIYQKGSDSVGGFNLSSTVDVKDLTQMTAIGTRYLSMFQSFEPVSASVITAQDYQEITFKEVSVSQSGGGTVSHWLMPKDLFNVGQMIEIYTEQVGTTVIDGITYGNLFNAIITARTISVTPDTWTTTYTLWKGFTA